MPTFKISHIGREKLSSFHRVNRETLYEDPLIKEFDPSDVATIMKITQANFRDTGKYTLRKRGDVKEEEEKKMEETITPLNEVLESVNKDDILRKKKKRPTTSVSEVESSSSSSSTTSNPSQITLSYARPNATANTNNYFGTQNKNQKSAIKVTLYNKGYERDLM